ncbi:MAG: ethanolamine ammonia-lyase subunit EutB [Syntrophotaleaceae bacterium]
MQTLNGFAFGVGDIVIGTNPVDSQLGSHLACRRRSEGDRHRFRSGRHYLSGVLFATHGQAAAEEAKPGSTAIWFQSLAGTESANKTFDLTLQKMVDYAKMRKGPYGLYFETGQGADFTNGLPNTGFDMVWFMNPANTVLPAL